MPAIHVSAALWLCAMFAWPTWRVSADGQPSLLLRGGRREEVEANSEWLELAARNYPSSEINAVIVDTDSPPAEECDVNNDAAYPDYRPKTDTSMVFIVIFLMLWGCSAGIIWICGRNMFKNVAQASENRVWKSALGSRGRSTNVGSTHSSADTDSSPSRSTRDNMTSRVEKGEGKLTFPDRLLEERWLAESEEELLQRGFNMLAFISLTLCAIRSIRWLALPLPKASCSQSALMVYWFRQIFRSSALLGICIASMLAQRNPLENRRTYYGFVVFYTFFIPALNGPPFTKTCWTLHRVDGELRPEVGEFYDCSIQGMGSSMLFVSFILSLPWILPRYGMMKLVWVWLVVVYVGVSLAYVKIFVKPGWVGAGSLPHWSGEPSPLCLLLGFFWMGVSLVIAAQKKWFLEKAFRNRKKSGWTHIIATKKMYKILSFMIPEHVIIPMLRNPGEPIALPIDKVSILFLEIDKFDEFSGNKRPKVVLAFLNKLFNQMEEICQNFEVTKIETWGHEFVACVGNTPADEAITQDPNQGHHHLVEKMMLAGAEFLRLQTKELEFRIGVHTGPIVAGVVGHKLPRYRLFGDTINTAARQMQRSQPGMLQFGEETKLEVDMVGTLEYDYRGEVQMKGKGAVKAYFLNIEATLKSNEATGRYKAVKRLTSQTSCGAINMLGVAAMSPTFWRAVGTFKHRLRQSRSLHGTIKQAESMGMSKSMFDEDGHVDDKQLAKNKEFADIMKSLGNADIEDDNLNSFLKEIMQNESQEASKCFSFRSSFFTKEIEGEWINWHFENAVCKKLTQRMGRSALALFGLTCLEAWYLTAVHMQVYDITMMYGQRGIATYALSRLGALVIAMIWWHLVESREKMVKANPRRTLKLMVVSCWIQAMLMYVGYDALLLHRDDFITDPTKARPMERTSGAVLFSLIYFFISRTHQFLARHQIAFVAGALFLCWGAPFIGSKVGGLSEHCLWGLDGRLLFLFTSCLCWMLAREEEQESRSRFRARYARNQMKERSEKALKTLMPELVVKELADLEVNSPLPTHVYRHAIIAQSDLCGFTDLAKTKTPTQVVEMMSHLFGRFDRASDERDIYKVETVGDAYIAGMAEAPLTEKNSPAAVVMFGLDMIKEVHKWSESINAGVRCRVGIHYGECIGGVVGYEMQRYHLFGPYMNALEVLESTGEPSRVQISRACKDEVERQLDSEAPELARYKSQILGFTERDSPEMKTSKGEIHHYDEVGGRTFFVRFKESPTWPP